MWVIVMIIGVASSAIKAKKKKDEAVGHSGQGPKPAHKSFSEILEELANPQEQEPEPVEWRDAPRVAREFVYGDGRSGHAEFAYEEGGRVTKDMATTADRELKNKKEIKSSRSSRQTEETSDPETNPLNEILGGEFDLRRAVIEAEILKPKFEQY